LFKRAVQFFLRPPSTQQLRVIPWFKANGDKTLRLNYDLNPRSLVLDLGGYEGQWASDIYAKYKCKIFIFEPYQPYAENIRRRFEKNPDITVFDVGLSSVSKEMTLGISDDSSSIFKKSKIVAPIRLESALSFFERYKIDSVDLMKVNIEGGEFDLLDHLLENKLTDKIKNIQVQFHDFVPNAYEWRKKIQERFSLTHCITYNYDFVWENWELKPKSF